MSSSIRTQAYDIYKRTTQLYLHTINNQMYDQTFIEYILFTIYTTILYVQNISVIVHSQL